MTSRSIPGRASSPDSSNSEPGCRLVGHSRGGASSAASPSSRPMRSAGSSIYRAYLLPAGESVAAEARRDTDSLIAAQHDPVAQRRDLRGAAEVLREAFYGDCTDEDFEFARDAPLTRTAQAAGDAAAISRRALRPRAARLHRNHARPRRHACRRNGACRPRCPAIRCSRWTPITRRSCLSPRRWRGY